MARLTQTLAGRLARVYATFGAVALVLTGLSLAAAPQLTSIYTERVLSVDLQGLKQLHAKVGLAEFAVHVSHRADADVMRGSLYLLADRDGRFLAGTLPLTVLKYTQPDVWRSVRLPLPDDTQPTRGLRACLAVLPDGAQLVIAYDLATRERYALTLLVGMLAAVFATSLAGAAIATVYARTTARRLASVSSAMEGLLAGNLSQRLPTATGHPDIDRVATEFNSALDRIEQLATTLRAVSDSTAHDLRAPLNRIRLIADRALRSLDDSGQERLALEKTVTEIDQLHLMLDALLRIAAAESGIAPTEELDLSPVVQDVVELYRPLAEERRQEIIAAIAPSVLLRGNRQLLAQAIANLMDNAVKYTPEGGSITVMLSAGARDAPDKAVVEVRDTGPGIAAADRETALRRSMRLQNALGIAGGGLGLSVVGAVAHLHGGELVLLDHHPGQRPPGLVARLILTRR